MVLIDKASEYDLVKIAVAGIKLIIDISCVMQYNDVIQQPGGVVEAEMAYWLTNVATIYGKVGM